VKPLITANSQLEAKQRENNPFCGKTFVFMEIISLPRRSLVKPFVVVKQEKSNTSIA